MRGTGSGGRKRPAEDASGESAGGDVCEEMVVILKCGGEMVVIGLMSVFVGFVSFVSKPSLLSKFYEVVSMIIKF